jgi:PAS domain S-box-containing protein
MDKVFVRNYALFFFTVVLCAASLIYILISGNKTISQTDNWIAHTNDVIIEAQQISTLVEGMLASQRGYIITGQDEFFTQYNVKKERLSERLAHISELLNDNGSQASRLAEMRDYFTELSTKLEEGSLRYRPTQSAADMEFLDDAKIVDNLKDNIVKLNIAILQEEYSLLNRRVAILQQQKANYFMSLLVGVVVASAMLLLFNGFLLHAQRKRSRVEASLKDTEQRFALAVAGTQDGIFDWNLNTGEVFYSRQFFGMLGYDREAFIGTTEEFKEILHPEDAPSVWDYTERYLSGEISEYSQEFRAKNYEGRWVWIQSRAKAVLDPNGKPTRLIGAHTDISSMKEKEARLEAAKKFAEDANRAKSDFLAHMSHEIRTPLAAISGIAEIFEKNHESFNQKHKKLVRTLHSSTSILKDLVNDILDFSKIESGELELDEETFNLGLLFEEVISMMAVRANEKAISFVFDYSEVKNINFVGDKVRMRQILINLVGNAIKFTTEGGVTIKAHREERQNQAFLRIDITDTGTGIAPENFDLVFERFKQADSSVSRKYGGTGLGLSISKNLANLMGGTIILSSELGRGSVFSVLLPFKVGLESEIDDVDFSHLHTKLNERIGAHLQQGGKILIVEDYEGNILVLSHLLDDIGCNYDIAKTGLQALDLWKANRYHMILMDIQMPEMDGFAATAAIRELERLENLARTPIIGMTAHALVGDKDKCIAAGMDAYLPKPIVEADVKRQILKYLNITKTAA